MDLITKSTFAKWFMAAMLIMNIALIVIVLTQRCPHKNIDFPAGQQGQQLRQGDGLGGSVKLMKNTLDLSDEQAAKFEQMRNHHFIEAEAVRDSIFSLRKLLFAEIFKKEGNLAIVDSIISKLGVMHSKVDKLQYLHFSEFSKICDEKQKEKLAEVLKNIQSKMGPPSGRGPMHRMQQ